MRFARAVGGACLVLLMVPRGARGQQAPGGAPAVAADLVGPPSGLEAGVRTGYDWGLEAWSLGGQVRVLIVPGLYLIPSGDYYLRSPGAPWQLNLDLAFRVGWYGGLYGGAGLAVAHRTVGSGRTQTGLNAFLGFTPPRLGRRTVWPFVEGRWLLIQNQSPFSVLAGINILLARGDGARD